ncbi:MAG TPA: ABC transporter permease [Mycobacteriales bacterium]|nr:ABC transporter permease [Mycobacteriales bacterium]
MTVPPLPVETERSRVRSIAAIVGSVIIGLIVLIALLSLVWTPYDPTAVDPAHTLEGAGWHQHALGTDAFGRDTASQLMAGAQVTLLAGLVSVGIAGLIGIPVGILAGMRPQWTGEFLMRGADVLFAFPALLLAILFAAAFGASTWTAMIAIGISTIPVFARLCRSATLQVMSREFIEAARAAGQGGFRIAWRHVLPNIAAVILVQASVAFGIAILAEAALAYLGLSTRPPTPSWGRLLHDAQGYLFSSPQLAIWPGVAIAVTVLAFTLAGDGFRDRLDPALRDRS